MDWTKEYVGHYWSKQYILFFYVHVAMRYGLIVKTPSAATAITSSMVVMWWLNWQMSLLAQNVAFGVHPDKKKKNASSIKTFSLLWLLFALSSTKTGAWKLGPWCLPYNSGRSALKLKCGYFWGNAGICRATPMNFSLSTAPNSHFNSLL